ncbi:N-acetylmuramoyl-L-alanine amidase family protein [Paenibacillus sp. HWE-109]|uniref:N-acetylmuramoyl-L-alanine amidase family protein n=1 Tax=Paenibacillus sp. HWE-109 TaxID=1306526 RepID=UPI001EDEDB2A|nr:N-acetylmuramoyl-L-alanine amidase family protein [Paenibacillus sp. HWE-109]UKS30534.1 N-acetylmuramoyl-L-alanine amidase family protein [Paenibacillus sp. HWE-109]
MMKFPAFCLILLVCMLLLPSYALGAESPAVIKLFMNEKRLTSTEVAPHVVSGNTIVPVRIIVQEIGAKVTWNAAARQVTIVKDDVNIQLVIDSKMAVINGAKEQMEVAPVIENGNTMLPLSFIGKRMGIEFKWDAATSSVHMFKPEDGDSKPVTGPVDNVDKPENGGVTTPKPTKPGTGTNPNPGTGTDPTTPDQNVHLLTSISLTDKELIVNAKDGTLAPIMMKLANPNRLVFDFPNTKLDESLQKLLVNNAGELPSKHALVQKIRFSNFADNPATVRIILDLKGAADYKTQVSKLPNQWSASIVEHQLTVVIDAGHGDQDPGALSITGKHEKEFTLATAKKVEKLLAQDKRVVVMMTRADDTFIPLDDRVSFANNNMVDLFLSIHGNSAKATVSGTETYYNRPESIDFANVVHEKVVAATGFPDRKVRQADYRVITKTTMPAVLVEVGYLSNKNDETAMYKEAFQDKVAASIAAAIKQYLGLK